MLKQIANEAKQNLKDYKKIVLIAKYIKDFYFTEKIVELLGEVGTIMFTGL